MLYAAWVMYYAITKRRYAFYHPMMWNMSVVALLSIIAILTPVVFFITDIANYTIAGWGDYFRWVGAAAASVIVWEWVERIEALEREERKDGILGREIYDGDDMLDTTPSSTSGWLSKRQNHSSGNEKNGGSSKGGFSAFASGHTGRFSDLAHRLGRKMTESPRTEARKKRNIHIPAPAPVLRRSDSTTHRDDSSRPYVRVQTPPAVPVVASPVSRTDTTSADSTVYTVRYHPISETPPNRQTAPMNHQQQVYAVAQPQPSAPPSGETSQPASLEDPEKGGKPGLEEASRNSRWQWQVVGNPFRRKGRTPPQELQRGRVIEPLAVEDVTVNIPPRNYNGIALSDRLGTFAAQQGEKFRSKKKSAPHLETNLPVTIIPAQPRGQTWSPDIILQQQRAQQDEASNSAGTQLAGLSATIEEEEEESTRTQSDEGRRSREAMHSPSSPHSSHSPRVRHGPAAVVLGAEVRQSGTVGSSLPPLNESTATIDFSPAQRQTRTDHDR